MQKKRRVHSVTEGKHIVIAGKTGMGKTTLIKGIVERKLELNPHKNVYHIDTKKRGDFSSSDGTMIISDVAPDAFKTTGNRMVWQPIDDNITQYSNFFMKVLNAGLPAIVDVDESINMRFGNAIPRGLSIILIQGRLPGIDVIGGTAEIAKSPRQLLSQATHIFSFRLLNDYDARTMAGYLHIKKEDLHLKKGEFWHVNTDSDSKATKYDSYQDFIHKMT